MIENTDRKKSKNEVGVGPEPTVLMENQQDQHEDRNRGRASVGGQGVGHGRRFWDCGVAVRWGRFETRITYGSFGAFRKNAGSFASSGSVV